MLAPMITRAVRHALALGTVVVTSLAAPAVFAGDVTREDRMPSSYAALLEMKPMDVMHMIDEDDKGYVTRDEFMKFQEALFDRADKNRDDRLSTPEFTDRG